MHKNLMTIIISKSITTTSQSQQRTNHAQINFLTYTYLGKKKRTKLSAAPPAAVSWRSCPRRPGRTAPASTRRGRARPRRRPHLRRCLVAAHRPAPARRRTGPRQRRLAGQVEEVAGVMRTRGCGLATESHRLVGGEHWTCLLSRLRPRPARVGATPHCPTGRKPGNARSRSDAGDCGPIRWPCG